MPTFKKLALAYDPRKRAHARNLCFQAVDKAEEIKAQTMRQKNQLLGNPYKPYFYYYYYYYYY